MPALTPEDVESITKVEEAFGTTRLLPNMGDAPATFDQFDNPYQQVVSALFYGGPLPDYEVAPRPGFEEVVASGALQRCIRAHLSSWEPKHEHKMRGAAYLLSQIVELKPVQSIAPTT